MCMGLLFLRADEWAQDLCHSVTAGLFRHIKRTWNKCLRTSVFSFILSYVRLLFIPSHLSPLWSLLFSPFPCLPSFLGEGGYLNLEQKAQGRKLCRNIWNISPFSVLRNVIHTQGTVSKEAESSWLKPDNAHGSLQLLQILVLLLWLFVLLLPLGPSRVLVYLCSVPRSCQKMRAGLPFWPQVNSLKFIFSCGKSSKLPANEKLVSSELIVFFWLCSDIFSVMWSLLGTRLWKSNCNLKKCSAPDLLLI